MRTEKLRSLSWKGPGGNQLDLVVDGYQFPETEAGYDANWLTLQIRAKNERGSWKASSSCILTWELRWLARWLAHVVHGGMKYGRDCVMENDIEFVYVNETRDGHRFAICLKYELSHPRDEGTASIVNVELTPKQHLDAVRYLRTAYLKYPLRGDQGKRSWKLPGPQRLKWNLDDTRKF